MRAKLATTKARLWRIAAFDAFFLPLAILFVGVILIATGAIGYLNGPVGAVFSAIIALAFVLLLVRGLFSFKPPTEQAAREALDRTDPDRPLSGLSDFPAQSQTRTAVFWKQHKASLQRKALALSPPKFVADWRQRDLLYLRYLLPVLALAFVYLNASTFLNRMSHAFNPDFGSLFGAERLEISGWITPPDYTGQAPVFLKINDPMVSVPVGSQLTLRALGPEGVELKRRALNKDDSFIGERDLAFLVKEDGAQELEVSLDVSQNVQVNYWGERAKWSIQAEQDKPPEVAFVSSPEADEREGFRFTWSASDDYGVVNARLVLTTPDDGPLASGNSDRIIIDLPSEALRSLEETTKLNLERHKWVGETLDLQIEVEDAIGQTTLSEPVSYVLPGKLFLEPMAKVNQEIRLELLREEGEYDPLASNDQTDVETIFSGLGDRLARAPPRVQRAAFMLEGATYRPDVFARDQAIYLSMRRAYETVRVATGMSDLVQLDQLLWLTALRSEFGTLADAARRLEVARRALERALREGASEDEVRRLMQAFRDAAEDYIAARMAEALMNPNGAPPPEGEGGGMVGGQDLEDMLSALEDLTETGASDAARQLLDDVANLLNNLDFQAGGGGEGGTPFGENGSGEPDTETSEEEQALERALETLSDLMEEQRRLNDDTFQERQGNGDPQGGTGQGEQQSDQFGETGEDEGSLADRQRTIIDELQAFSEQLGEDDTGNGTSLTADEFEEALQSLGRAERALEGDDLDRARWNQDRAIQALRDAAGDLAEQLDAETAARRGEVGENDLADEDPLGRPAGGMQMNTESGVELPDEIERQRAKDILDELRERLDQAQDDEERDYLNRLLDRFSQ